MQRGVVEAGQRLVGLSEGASQVLEQTGIRALEGAEWASGQQGDEAYEVTLLLVKFTDHAGAEAGGGEAVEQGVFGLQHGAVFRGVGDLEDIARCRQKVLVSFAGERGDCGFDAKQPFQKLCGALRGEGHGAMIALRPLVQYQRHGRWWGMRPFRSGGRISRRPPFRCGDRGVELGEPQSFIVARSQKARRSESGGAAAGSACPGIGHRAPRGRTREPVSSPWLDYGAALSVVWRPRRVEP